MNVEVRYYSKSGNTKKLAEEIAKVINKDAKTIKTPLKEDVDILFLGSSVYKGNIDDLVKDFIANINVYVGKVIPFGTSAFGKTNVKQIERLLYHEGILTSKDHYYCKGQFGPFNRKKPNEKNLEEVRNFTKKIIEQEGY